METVLKLLVCVQELLRQIRMHGMKHIPEILIHRTKTSGRVKDIIVFSVHVQIGISAVVCRLRIQFFRVESIKLI